MRRPRFTIRSMMVAVAVAAVASAAVARRKAQPERHPYCIRLDLYPILLPSESGFFDPFDPDFPPMPNGPDAFAAASGK